MEKYLTTADVAAKTNVTIRTVQGWIQRQFLPAKRFGRDYYILASDLEKFEKPKRGPKFKTQVISS